MTFIKIASMKDIKINEATHISKNGWEIAIFNCGGKIFATNGICPHEAGFLAEGFLDGSQIVCPLHGWRFDVMTGKGVVPSPPGSSIKIYNVLVKDGEIMVDL
jgi:nitrite reductase/ring-hydroxylating ferredoxin subunit